MERRAGRRPFACALFFLSFLSLATGCNNSDPDEPFDNYLQRLGRALSVDSVAPAPTALPRPPRSGSLRIDIDSAKIDALDFLALSGCEVQVTIGKRNSSLGRLARDSQRLLLELEYLRLAPACVEAMRAQGRNALADELEQAWRSKQEQLPALIFNATLGGEEFRSFWLSGGGKYPAVRESYSADALRAINQQIKRWLAGDYRSDNWQFEIHLSEVAGGPGGALLQALSRQADWLAAADKMLEARMARGPLCAPSVRHRGADILPNVVRRYFVEGIQPGAALLERRRYDLLPTIVAVEAQLDSPLPSAYRTWKRSRDEFLHRATSAPLRHVNVLREIQRSCGTLITDPPDRDLLQED